MKRTVSIALALFMLVCPMLMLVGCAKSTTLLKIDPTAEESRVVGKVGEFDVYYDELRYITMSYKEEMEDKYGDDIWKTEESAAPYIDELSEKVYSAITANYGALTLAKQNGITVNDDAVAEYCYLRMEELATSVLQIMMNSQSSGNGGGAESESSDTGESEDANNEEERAEDYVPSNRELNEAYKKQLEKTFLTDRYIRFIFSVDACVEQLVIKYVKEGKLYTADEDIEQYIRSNFCRTLHIFVRNDKGESVEENREIAERVLSDLESGKKSFNALVGSIDNDDLMMTTSNGYYFARGEMAEEYEEAAYDLAVGEHSGVVETEGGFYIIKRLEIKDDYINTYFEQLKTQYHYAVVNSDIAAERAKLSFVLSDLGSSIELWSMK